MKPTQIAHRPYGEGKYSNENCYSKARLRMRDFLVGMLERDTPMVASPEGDIPELGHFLQLDVHNDDGSHREAP
jgi:hypothetical protein